MSMKHKTRKPRRNDNQMTGLTRRYAQYLSQNTNIITPPMRASGMVVTTTLTANFVLLYTSTGSGVAGISIPEHPGRSITSFNGFTIAQNTEWSSYASLFDEFRVKAMIVEFVPVTTSTGSSVATTELCVVADYDSELSAGQLTSMQSAYRYSTGRMVSPVEAHQFVFQPPKKRAFTDWQSTANSTARGCVYYALKTTVNTLPVGNAVVKWIVTFRGQLG